MDDIFKKYSKKTLIKDVICENCSLVNSGTKKATFTVWKDLKEPLSVLNTILQRGKYDIEKDRVIKMNIKLQSHHNISSRNHKVMIRYHTH